MKSGTSYWNLSFVIHNLLAFAAVIGLQYQLLYTITKSITVVAVALPQAQTVVGVSAALVDSLQFNAFDTTRTTFASSSSSGPSSDISSSPSLEGGDISAATQEKISLPAFPSALSYPTSTTIAGFHNTKTSKVMSNINSISPTQTINNLHTTFRSKSTSRSSRDSSIRNSSSSSSDISGKSLGNKMVGKLQAGSYTFTPTASSVVSSSVSLKNVKKSKSTIRGINSETSTGSDAHNNGHQHEQQNFPLDFTFSKNHWTNSDAALNGGVDAKIGGNVNFRLGSLSSVTSSVAASSSSSSSSSSLSLASAAAVSSSISAFSASSSASLTTETERPRIFRNKHHHERHWGPFFEEPLNSTTSGDNSITTAHLYTEAVLNCRVGMLKDKTVMWVRRTSEKVSLLTVGNVTYSSDPRIRVKFQYPNNWRLLINPTQWEDAGIYMCQVSTHPPRVFTTNLTVIEPPLRLIDDQERDVGDRYYKTGSTIDLYCQVSRSFLYKEKQNILKSLKPLNVHNKKNTTITSSSRSNSGSGSSSGSSNSSNSVTATSSSSNSFFGTTHKNSGTGSENISSPGYSNINNNDQTKMTANNKNNKQAANYDSKTNNGMSALTVSGTTGFDVFSHDLFPNTKQQSTTSVEKAATAGLEQQFSSLVFWSKNDETLPSTALKRSSSSDKWFTSRVTITDAKLTDSGNYSCSIGRMYTVIVQVQVLTGELPAAVQHNSAATFVVLNESIRELIQLYWFCITAAYILLN